VTVATPTTQEVATFKQFTGRTQSAERVEIRARVEGYLERIDYDFTTKPRIEAGQLLFVIDKAPFEAAVARADATLKSKQAQLRDADWELDRIQGLHDKDVARERELQEAMTAQALATAEVMAAQAALDSSNLDLGYTEVRSPIAGLVSRNLVDVGALVGSGENTLLTTVARMDPIHVYFPVSEQFLLPVIAARRGQDGDVPLASPSKANIHVRLGLGNDESFPYEGVIDFTENTVDPTTGTMMLRAVFDNADRSLFAGLFARIQFPLETLPSAVIVEERALGTDLGGKFVLVVGSDNVVEHRPVKIGALHEGRRVIASGLAAGDRYIVDGLLRARPGLPVNPIVAAQAAPPTPITPVSTAPPKEPASGNSSTPTPQPGS
jgi:RND family efflux transporter MFP subunit